MITEFIYGTAWKKNDTARLVKTAISVGFRAIDTANQPKHYSESLVGEALLELEEIGIKRDSLFLQTKFTSVNGQDERIPYDPYADYETQVQTSFKSSLEHLHTSYVDSYLLHGPLYSQGLVSADLEIWRAIEEIHQTGKAKLIGVSNFNFQQLQLLINESAIKPMIVQNRCFASQGWDKAVREFCHANKIMYQGFSLLTANSEVLQSASVATIARRVNKTPAQVIFRFSNHIGIVPLTGTTNEQHMTQDLESNKFDLTQDEILTIENIYL